MLEQLSRRLEFTWRYLRGRTPWDSGIVPPEVTGWLAAYQDSGHAPGRALDLGCGTGTTSRYLAERGWTVVGIDFAPNAIQRARRKAQHQPYADRLRFLRADVSRPDLLAGENPFDLVIDIGCLHSLPPAARIGYAANVARLTAPDATLLVYAFLPRLRSNGRGMMGFDQAELTHLMTPAFTITNVTMGRDAANPDLGSGWYTLRRAAPEDAAQ